MNIIIGADCVPTDSKLFSFHREMQLNQLGKNYTTFFLHLIVAL